MNDPDFSITAETSRRPTMFSASQINGVLYVWAAFVATVSVIYLTGGLLKAVLIGTFVLVSCVLGLGRRWLLHASFAVALVAIAVWLGAPPPGQWFQVMRDAGDFLVATGRMS